MYYEINVSLNGRHFFATAERSILNESEMKEKYAIILSKFPVEEGYKVTVTHWTKTGTPINMEG